MKSLIRPVLTSVLLVLGLALSGTALADRGGHGHGGHGGWHGSYGFYFGFPFYGPGYYPAPYYYPPYYYPPSVVVPSSPPVYIEQGGTQAAPGSSQQNWWYYCGDSKTYYPYVKECPGGWQRVEPQPPSGG